jgi:hypothetical protein
MDTVEEIKNEGLVAIVTVNLSQFLNGKLDLNKTLNPNVAAAADYMSVGACITP